MTNSDNLLERIIKRVNEHHYSLRHHVHGRRRPDHRTAHPALGWLESNITRARTCPTT
jgi:hypothetical protein